MTTQKWRTLQPMKEKRDCHAVCIQGDRIIVAGGNDGSYNVYTCGAFDTVSKRFVLPIFAVPKPHSYSVSVNLPSRSTLPRITAKHHNFSMVCLPPDLGGLIAIGGNNAN